MPNERLRLYYPVSPFFINQHFGDNVPCVVNFGTPSQTIQNGADNNTCPPGYEKLYAKFGMAGHNGTDLRAGEQTVYAACAGTVIEKQLIASRGLGLGIITDGPVSLDQAGQSFIKIRYWHLKSFNVEVGQHVEVGDPIGVSDNTGYSSGDHLHFEGMPMVKDGAGHWITANPNNGFEGAIDIEPFFSGIYATAVPMLIPWYQRLITLLQKEIQTYPRTQAK
jgi:murein DD-endopeptidase MepM/ murein hydrolase activator NlpD